MKGKTMKFLSTSLLLISLICTPVCAGETTEPCGNGTGRVVIGNNGKSYCRSQRNFNWWSAMSWCQAVGMEPVSVNEDCICSGEQCPSSQCPNFHFSAVTITQYWSSSLETRGVFSIHPKYGDANSMGSYGNPTSVYPALCKMP